MKDTLESRIAELEKLPSRVRQLENEIASLRAGGGRPALAPAAVVEEGARVLTGRQLTGRRFVMPTEEELDELLRIVLHRYPQLAPPEVANPRWRDDDRREHRA